MAYRFNRSPSMTVLAVYLILAGVVGLIGINMPPQIMPVLALIAGVLILIGR